MGWTRSPVPLPQRRSRKNPELMRNGWKSFVTTPYTFAARARTWLYDHGWLKSRRLPCPVVSVGNLTVGGTGKTPVTMWVAQRLLERGRKVGILSRGYRRKSRKEFVLVSNGRSILAGHREAGDEPYFMARRCPGVIVAVGADRYQLGRWVLRQMPIDCFVLDDGFQHLGLHRDVNLLLIDGSDVNGMEDLLPMGRLREPLDAAQRASEIIITRVEREARASRVVEPIETVLGTAIHPITTRFTVQGLHGISASARPSLAEIQGKSVLIFSGVGNPQQFRRTVDALNVRVVSELVFQDHDPYAPSTVEKIYRHVERFQPDLVLTTEKDLVKCQSNWSIPTPVFAVRLTLEFVKGRSRLEAALEAVSRA